MSIENLIEAIKATKITHEQVAKLRAQLKNDGSDKHAKSSTKEFLARTYSL